MPRPKLKPTDEQRSLVKSLAAVGTPQALIARKISIRSPKTLRKYFREELDFGATEANANVGGALYKTAMNGNVDAQKFWLERRAGWGRPVRDIAPPTPPPFVIAHEPEPPPPAPLDPPKRRDDDEGDH
jgi:hypothetical protein